MTTIRAVWPKALLARVPSDLIPATLATESGMNPEEPGNAVKQTFAARVGPARDWPDFVARVKNAWPGSRICEAALIIAGFVEEMLQLPKALVGYASVKFRFVRLAEVSRLAGTQTLCPT